MTTASGLAGLPGLPTASSGLNDASSIQALRSAAARDPKAAIKETAKQFEALFMQQLMKSMREATISSGMLDNKGTKLGTEMLDSQYATKMTGLPGGLGEVIARQLERQMGVAPATKAVAGAPYVPGIGADIAISRRQAQFVGGHGADARQAEARERHSGRVHARAGRARIGVGPARDPQCRRQRLRTTCSASRPAPAGPGRSPRSRPPNTSTARRRR